MHSRVILCDALNPSAHHGCVQLSGVLQGCVQLSGVLQGCVQLSGVLQGCVQLSGVLQGCVHSLDRLCRGIFVTYIIIFSWWQKTNVKKLLVETSAMYFHIT